MATQGYEGRIGRYGAELADALTKATGVRPRQRALDVGCGPGALTVRLVELLGADRVAAVDPDPDARDAAPSGCPTSRSGSQRQSRFRTGTPTSTSSSGSW